MADIVIYAPHPDDETLSMALPIVTWLAGGLDVHLVSVCAGAVAPGTVRLTGGAVCGLPEHLYAHSPTQEGYPEELTPECVGEARVREARSALGAATRITPNPGVAATGRATHSVGGLASPLNYADVRALVLATLAEHPGAAHYTMSPTDDHPDHAVCGQALRDLQRDPECRSALAGAKFFISRLYWATTLGAYPADILAEGPAWFPTTARKPEYDAVARKMRDAFFAWSPAHGAYAVGGHQVPSQFARCFPAPNSSQAIAALWHD